MSTLKLLFAEIRYRKVNFVLSLLAVMIAVTLFVAAPVLVDGYRRETHKQVGRWEAQVAELQQRVAAMRDGMARVEADTAAELGRLEKEMLAAAKNLEFENAAELRDTIAYLKRKNLGVA